MSRAQFFPYPAAEGSLELRCLPTTGDIEVSDTGRIIARGVPDDEPIELRLEVTVGDDILDRVIPPMSWRTRQLFFWLRSRGSRPDVERLSGWSGRATSGRSI